jgi:hypothetical protein
MYLSMYVCRYVYIYDCVCMYVCMYVYERTYVRIYLCMYECVCIYVREFIHIWVCVCVCVCVWMNERMNYVYMYTICKYAYVCMHEWTYVCICVIHSVDSEADSSTGSREATEWRQKKRNRGASCRTVPLVLLIKVVWRQGKGCGSETDKVMGGGLLRECIGDNKVDFYCMVAEFCCKMSSRILQRYIQIWQN